MRTLVRNLLVTGALLLTGAGAVFVAKSASALPQKGAEDTFNRKCAVCHARDGSGNTPRGKKYNVKDIRTTIKKQSEEEMITIVTKGKGDNMDAFGDELKADEIKAVVEYYRGLAKSK
jgi:mono/diheme cytochrome c family protein